MAIVPGPGDSETQILLHGRPKAGGPPDDLVAGPAGPHREPNPTSAPQFPAIEAPALTCGDPEARPIGPRKPKRRSERARADGKARPRIANVGNRHRADAADIFGLRRPVVPLQPTFLKEAAEPELGSRRPMVVGRGGASQTHQTDKQEEEEPPDGQAPMVAARPESPVPSAARPTTPRPRRRGSGRDRSGSPAPSWWRWSPTGRTGPWPRPAWPGGSRPPRPGSSRSGPARRMSASP
jgi:hypothetical protein